MRYAHLLAQKWNIEDQEAGKKPTALNTPFRYSAAHGCSRAWVYGALAEPTEEWDVASTWVTRLGTLIHEEAQLAMGEVNPMLQFEVASKINAYISGSADGWDPVQGHLLEIKTVGNYVWSQQTGFGNFKRSEPKGPKAAAIVQAGLNAIGINIALLESNPNSYPSVNDLCLITMAKEAVSIAKADKMGIVDDYERFVAEWWYPRHEWEDAVTDEIGRFTVAGEEMDEGYLPKPVAVDDDYRRINLSPTGDAWQCAYCPFRTLCEEDGNIDSIMDSKLTPRRD
jgi:hypothetical protein